jgi:hypothetical protein
MLNENKKIYLVWDTEGYWCQYDSIQDAVSDKGDGSWVYVAKPRYLGRYKIKKKVELIRMKNVKRRKAK